MRKDQITTCSVVYAVDSRYSYPRKARPCVILDTGQWSHRSGGDNPWTRMGLGRRAGWLALFHKDDNPDVLLAAAQLVTIPSDPPAEVPPVPPGLPDGVRVANVLAKDVVRLWSEQPAHEAAQRTKDEAAAAERRAKQAAIAAAGSRYNTLVKHLGVDLRSATGYETMLYLPVTGVVTVLERLAKAEGVTVDPSAPGDGDIPSDGGGDVVALDRIAQGELAIIDASAADVQGS